MRVALLVVCLAGCGRIGFDEGIPGGDDTSALSLTPTSPVTNLGSQVRFEVTGGTPPYTFTLDGAGVLRESTFVAPSRAGRSTVTATDVDGLTGSTTITYRGDTLFLVGGRVGGSSISSVLRSDNGGVTWTQVGDLPLPRANGALVAYDDALFYIGGLDGSGNTADEVFKSTNGTSWSQVGTIPATNAGLAGTVHDGEMWIVGGNTSDSTAAFHSIDGVTWVEAPGHLAVGRHEHDLVSRDGILYVLGGHGPSLLDDIVFTTDGSTWTTASETLDFATDFAGAGELGDIMFRVCGDSCSQTETSTDGLHWTPGANLPGGPRSSPALVGFADRMLVIGGGSNVLSTIDGSSWAAIGSLPQSITLTAAVQFTPR